MKSKYLEKIIISKLPIKNEDKLILQRRINKLRKDPKVFFEDSIKKRSSQSRKFIPIKHTGVNNFTVVSAVYNVEKYLDDYFESLVNQSLSFKKHIQLILVDDGSTDASSAIIKKWQQKYPKNIHYIYKENGGQASARNIGMDYIENEWVTFIDPDDFICNDYFLNIDKFIMQDSDLVIISCPLISYLEDVKVYKNNHPLKYRYKNGNKIKAIKDIGKDLQLSASTAIFRTDKLSGIKFNNKIRPSFEDAKFVLDFILKNYTYKIGYINNIEYFYRKRSDGSSTLDNAWFNPGLFTTVLEHGVLKSLEAAETKLSYIPTSFQNTALYHLYWYFGRIINNEASLEHLTDTEKDKFYQLVVSIFDKIDVTTIESFNLAGAWFFHKVGFLGLFKDSGPSFQIVYVEDYDLIKDQVLVSFFTNSSVCIEYLLDDNDIIPSYLKKVGYSFINQKFVDEYRAWISCSEFIELSVRINGKQAKLSYKGKHLNKIDINKVKGDFHKSFNELNGSWLFIDRNTQADDNAEHLYRYIKNNKLKENIFFALNKNSHDWDRLNNEGFNLLDFCSEDFERELRSCNKIISSHVDGYITHYFNDSSLMHKDFIFLQHGVTKDDLSIWLNTKKNISKFITATDGEYRSICENGTPYKFTKKETVLTGFPRYDNLINNNNDCSKNILIMPTWRNNIVGKIISGNIREYNSGFMETEYAKHWHGFLNSSFMKDLVEVYGYSITFVPHPNIQEYMHVFTLPEYIDVWEYKFGNIQRVFQEAFFLITDYSSVAFDIAYLNKLVFYYQFDDDQVFSGSHTYRKGYYSYGNDGFGPVCKSEEQLISKIKEFLFNNDDDLLDFYTERISSTFPFRDDKNCERVYNAINVLDVTDDKKVNIDILHDFTSQAYKHKVWNLVELRSSVLIQYGNAEQIVWAKNITNEALFHQNKFTELFNCLDFQNGVFEQINYWRAKVAFATTRWQDTIKLLEAASALSNELTFMLLFSYAELGQVAEFETLKEKLEAQDLELVQSIMIQVWSLRLYEQWEMLIQLLDINLPNFSVQELRDYQPQVLMAQAYRQLSKFKEAHQQLTYFESHTINNPRCRIEIARLAFARDNYGKCINQYESAINGNIILLPETAIWQYLLSHWNLEHIERLLTILPEVMSVYPKNQEFIKLYFQTLAEDSQWTAILEQVSILEHELQVDIIYPITLAKYRLGFIDEAYNGCIKPTIKHAYKYWSLIGEIALLVENIELAKYCYKGMIAIYPEHDSPKNWIRFNSLKNNL